MNKKICFLSLIFLNVVTTSKACENYAAGIELGSVAISLFACVLQAHSNYSLNAGLHKDLGKQYCVSKGINDVYCPLMFATLQLTSLIASKSHCENSSPAVNCVLSMLNMVRIHYENSLKTSNYNRLLIQSLNNSKRAQEVINNYDNLMARYINVQPTIASVEQDSAVLHEVVSPQTQAESIGVSLSSELQDVEYATDNKQQDSLPDDAQATRRFDSSTTHRFMS
ncbi:MAG TPA: hypothetical protein VLG50_04555 [Candidatus Saccharimonadales bacterium]|nr:hypothetical protein [Candidatus Saccharimonadales bacterium]